MKLKFLLFFLIPISIYSTDDKNVKDRPEKSAAKGEIYVFDLQRMYIPINNKGVIADVNPGGYGAGGKFDNILFLFSSGFYNTGYSNDSMWSTGNLSASSIEDYHPGPVGSDSADSKNVIYSINATDPHFGESWQEWIDAVSIGADFYDGDGDSIYIPVDYNSNGLWDANEDRPDFLGDYTAWCVINDGVHPSRRIYNITPQGLEIRQTIFASEGIEGQSEDLFFVRYELANMGTITDVFDSVYFAAASDPDLGNYLDDLVACDTLANSGFIYNDSTDSEYGINSPAFFIKQLQGPPVFIPGITFIDNNSDNEYTNGIDTPLDSAIIKRGEYLGIEYIAGAKNLNPTSLINYYKSHPTHGDPNTYVELHNYLLGKDKYGNLIDPCTWPFGNGASLPNCSEVNPKFMYSGDPVTSIGWLPTFPSDHRFILSTGPFQIEVGKPVELIYAYIVGRGTDHLNSITVAREISQFAQQVYDNNFEDLPTGINDDENLIVNDFKLFQNYPNPFNPTTTIKFTIPSSVMLNSVQHLNSEIPKQVRDDNSIVQLKIYDILGREIKTLVNEHKKAGTYEIKFNGLNLSSGVYFYQLSVGYPSTSSGQSFIQTKKMMLLK